MRIALYYPWVYLTSGAERLILELVTRSAHEWTIFTNHFDREHTYPELHEQRVIELPKVPVERSFSKVLLAAIRIASQKLDLGSFDALLVVCEGLGDMILFRNHDRPVFCICLTPLRPVFDPVYRQTYLETRGWSAALKLRIFGAFFARLDRLAWRHYRRVLCISKEVYRRVLSGGLAEKEKLATASPGIDTQRLQPTGRREHFFLIPGRIMWTKNIELGIGAFQIFQKRCPRGDAFRLVIAGIVDKKSERYYSWLRTLARGDTHIEFVVHPGDEDLFDLYDRSYAVLFTPFNEDWGIVPLEAMAFAKPVIAVKRGGPLETVRHGENGFLAAPDAEEFAHYMITLANAPDEAERMGAQGRLLTAQYDWKHFVRAVDTAIEENV